MSSKEKWGGKKKRAKVKELKPAVRLQDAGGVLEGTEEPLGEQDIH